MPVTRLEIADHVRPAFALGSATRGAEQGRLLPGVLDPDVVSVVAARILAAAQADSADPSLALLETIEVAP
jgi:hypothetical protein